MFDDILESIEKPIRRRSYDTGMGDRCGTCTLCFVAFILMSSLLSSSLPGLPLPLRGPSGETILGLGTLSDTAYSPDGQTIATCGSLGVFLRDPETGELIRWFSRHSAVYSVAFSPDGSLLLTGSYGTAKLWALATGAVIRTFEHEGLVNSVTFSPDGIWVLTGGWDGTAILWHVATGAEVRTFGHEGYVSSVAFSPDGSRVLTRSWDDTARYHTARIWDVATGAVIQTFEDVTSIAFSPDGSRVLTGSRDGPQLWNVARRGGAVRTFGQKGSVYSVAFSPDGSLVLTASGNETILWDVATGAEIRTFGKTDFVTFVAFSPDSGRMLTGSRDGAILWNVATGVAIWTFNGHTTNVGVTAVAFSPDGSRVLTGSWDGAKLWDVARGAVIRTFDYPRSVDSVAFSPDGSLVLTASWTEAKLWDVATGVEILTFGHKGRVESVAFSPDGSLVLTGSGNEAKLWEVVTGAEIRTLEHEGLVESVAFSPDGSLILTGSWNGAKLWEVARRGAVILTFEGGESIAFSPDGSLILTGSWNGAKLWDVATGVEIHTFRGRAGSVESVAFSPDGSFVLTGSWQGADLWDVATGVVILTFAHEGLVDSVAFSPDGSLVLTGSRYGTARIWDISGILRVTATVPYPPVGSVDIQREPTLSWQAGKFVESHDVYFSTSFDAVNDGAASALVSESIVDAAFDPGNLDYNQTYFWRVDEVNSAPDFTVFAGNVWSFTTEPFSFPITHITATASGTAGPDTIPENTINGSGLTGDLHGTEIADMWLSDTIPAWIQYEFDRPYRLHEMWIWNSNRLIESSLGLGAKDVVIEHSTNGTDWTAMEGVTQLAQAPGDEGSAPSSVIDFGGVAARYARVTINSVYGRATQASLSEVRFYFMPSYAREPQPADGATTDSVDVTLKWRPGREAASHEVLLSSDPVAVQDGSAVVAIANDNSFTPDPLIYGTTYTWQVNEIYETETSAKYPGDLWTFRTLDFGLVDDMESYKEKEKQIWTTWRDGIGDPANGSFVVNDNAPETQVVYEGSQSMTFFFDNSTALISEATRPFDPPQDWVRGDPEVLSLFFSGLSSNDPARLYLVISDSTGRDQQVIHPDPAATQIGQWTEWQIPMYELSPVNLSSIASMTIGVGGQGSPGKGEMAIDNIRVGTPLLRE